MAGGSHASDIPGTYLIISHDSPVKLLKEKREGKKGERRKERWKEESKMKLTGSYIC